MIGFRDKLKGKVFKKVSICADTSTGVFMTTLFFVGLYVIIHLIVASIRAFHRARKYRYYYISRGVMPFPRSFARRVLHFQTFLYALLLTLLIFFLAILIYTE